MIVDPIRKYQIKPANAASGQVYPLLSVTFTLTAATNNQTILAAITGPPARIIRVMGGVFQSDANVVGGYMSLKNGSGGTKKFGAIYPSLSSLPPFLLPVIDSGYFETTAGVGLFADAGPQVMLGTIFYVAYVP